jgi:bifunctional DNase/RNase
MKRPLIHDLIETILRAFGAKIESVIINDLQRDTYFARFVLSAENEVHEKKIIAIDARPGDGIALATRSPIRFQREKAAEKKRFSSITSRGDQRRWTAGALRSSLQFALSQAGGPTWSEPAV